MGCAEALCLIPGLAHARQGLIERPCVPRCHPCLQGQLEERQVQAAI